MTSSFNGANHQASINKTMGINLGNSNISVSFIDDFHQIDKVEIFPLFMYFPDAKISPLICQEAIEKSFPDHRNAIYNFSDKILKEYSFFNGDNLEQNSFVIEEVLAIFLRKIIKKFNIKDLSTIDFVVSYPGYLNDYNARNKIETAFKLAGLKVKEFITKTEASLNYYLKLNTNKKENILILHLGHKATEISIFEINNSSYHKLSSRIYDKISGEKIHNDFLKTFMDLLQNNLNKKGLDIYYTDQKINFFKEKFKNTEIFNDTIECNDNKFEIIINRNKFFEALKELISDMEQAILSCLRSVSFSTVGVDRVLLIGGNFRNKILVKKLESIFPDKIFEQNLSQTLPILGLCLMGRSIKKELAPLPDNLNDDFEVVLVGPPKEKAIVNRENKQEINSEKEKILNEIFKSDNKLPKHIEITFDD